MNPFRIGTSWMKKNRIFRRQNHWKCMQGKVWIEINQIECISKLEQIPSNSDFDKFCSPRACLSFLGHSVPEYAAQLIDYAKLGGRTLNDSKLCKRKQRSKDMALKYGKPNLANLQIWVYSEVSFASNLDNCSKLGCIILLADESGTRHLLSYCSKKSNRIVRSLMAGEVFAFRLRLTVHMLFTST